MLILACVSGHGFGHGSRVASVLTALHQLQPDWRLVLSTPLPEAFLKLAFGPVPFELRPCRWDVGVIQADALGADGPATLKALDQLQAVLPAQLAREAHWLRRQAEPVLVLADVGPAAVELAAAIGAPLVWMGNFGWDAIYRPMGGAFGIWAERALALYRRGQAVIRCPFAMAMDWGLPHHVVGLTAGRPRQAGIDLASSLALDAPRDRTVMVGFGGMGFALDPQLFARWPQHRFLASDRGLATDAPNVRLMPAQLRPLDLMPLCGRIITKPGYSTFCEAMALGVGVHLVHREGFAEAPVLEAALQRHAPHRLLTRSQLLDGDWQLDDPLLPATGSALDPEGHQQAALLLYQLALQLTA